MQLERPGSSIPSFTVPALSRLIVTAAIRSELLDEFSQLEFVAVEYANVVPLNWHEWNPQASLPEKEQNYFMPDYIMDVDELDDMLIDEMPEIFELVPSTEIYLEMAGGGLRTAENVDPDIHFFDGIYTNANPHVRSAIISDTAKKWIESRQPEWLKYDQLDCDAENAV